MLIWLRNYRRELLAGDIVAGTIVALMLIPQGMAYAIVAGLPPVTGLYASILPPVAYALFGSSMVQSVGPMAITSLMIGTALTSFGEPGSPLNLVLAGQIALIAGLVLFLCGILRLGFLANLLSRPVMSGFTSGAAILIACGQIEPLVGGSILAINLTSTIVGLSSVVVLWIAKKFLTSGLCLCGLSQIIAETATKLAPVIVIVIATVFVYELGLMYDGVRVVGSIPSGLPILALEISSAHWQSLLMPSLLIGFMIFLSSQSAAQTLAQKRKERINTNHELLGLGFANLASAISGGFAVTGSISRTAVNHAAGANTPLASLISASLLIVVLLAPTTWLSMLPLPTLAATIIIAVGGMIDFETLRESWRYDRGDALALIFTAVGVLVFGVEVGVISGVVLSLATLLWRSSKPHIAVIGRIPGSEHFRNVERHCVETIADVLMLRIDANLFFGNASTVIEFIETELRARVVKRLETHHVVLVMSAINLVDMTGLHALIELNRTLRDQGTELHLAEVKGPVMDRLKFSDLIQKHLSGKVHLSAAEAYSALSDDSRSRISEF